ncbi:MAG: hypothetical protein ACO2O0_01235 [Desulfurococcales archaeon]|jgi:hypothetical protein
MKWYRMKKPFFISSLLLLIISSILLTPVFSSVFTYYPSAVSLQPVPPPIVLQDPSIPGVSVSLGSEGASASITVSLPYSSYSLTISQDVIYYTTFDSGLPTNWVDPPPACPWAVATIAWVGISISCQTAAIYEVAYYNSSIVSNTLTFYVGAYVRSGSLGGGRYVGITLYDRSTGNYYIAAIGNGNRLNILRCVGGTCNLVASTGGLGLAINTWYFLVAYWTPNTLSAYLYRTDTGALIGSISYSDGSPIGFNTVGFVVRGTRGWFDELVVAYDDPRAVYVDNVPSGWTVKIYNGTVLVNQATSAGTRVSIPTFYGTANSHYSTILRSGRIEVYDDLGNLRASRSEVIVTGRGYQLQVIGGSFDNRILNVVNLDSKGYYGLLSLRSPPSYSGFSVFRLYLCNPSGCSSALDIIAGSTSTSEIALPASQTSYIRLVAVYSLGASASIQIWLNYSTRPGQDGVVVSYPVDIILS